MANKRILRSTQRLGGLAVVDRQPPAYCPRCHRPIEWGSTWHQFLGHLGLHGLADKYFGGDIQAAQKRLRDNGLARQDPAPWNGAMPKYQPVTDVNNDDDPKGGRR